MTEVEQPQVRTCAQAMPAPSADPAVEVVERRNVRRVYDTIAGQYDHRVGAISEVDRYFVRTESRFVLSRVRAADRILDLGCGTGRYTVQFLARGYHVVGLDLSRAMVEVARGKAAPHAGPGRWAQAEMAHLPFRDGSFDVVTCVLAAMHLAVSERPRVFAEVARVLRPGGRFVLTCKNAAFERLSHVDKFATVDRTDVKRHRLVFTRLAGGGELAAQWNSFSPADLRRLSAGAGLRVTDLRGQFLLAAWLPDGLLRRPLPGRVVSAVERRLEALPLVNRLGYHLLMEATKRR